MHHILTLVDIFEYTAWGTHRTKSWLSWSMVLTLTLMSLLSRHDYLHPMQNIPQLCLHLFILEGSWQSIMAFQRLMGFLYLRKADQRVRCSLWGPFLCDVGLQGTHLVIEFSWRRRQRHFHGAVLQGTHLSGALLRQRLSQVIFHQVDCTLAILHSPELDVLSAFGLRVEFVSETFVVLVLLVGIGFSSVLSHFIYSSVVSEKQETWISARFLEGLDSNLRLQVDRRVRIYVGNVVHCFWHCLSLWV